MHLTLNLLTLLTIVGVRGIHKTLQDPWDNKFIKSHEAITTLANLSNCWLCTHSPISSATMPYIVRFLTVNETLVLDWDNLKNNTWEGVGNYRNGEVPLMVASYLSEPEWQVNLTADPEKKKATIFYWANNKWSSFKHSQTIVGALKYRSRITFGKGKVNDTDILSNVGCKQSDSYFLKATDTGPEPIFLPKNFNCTYLARHPLLQRCYCDWEFTKKTNKTAYLPLLKMAINMVGGYTALKELPRGYYYICGNTAYKWLPYGAVGTCTIGKIQPATWTWGRDEIPYQHIPKHTLYKREIKKGKPLVYQAWYNKFWKSLSIFGLPVQNMHNIESLAELLDNVTELVFDAINVTNTMLAQIALVTNQHTIVLDYLTASQGGMCQIVGPACCHWVDTNGTLQVTHDIETARRLKEDFRKAHTEDDVTAGWNLGTWFSWLNPANWFLGLGGWLGGLMHTAVYILVIVLGMYLMVKLLLCVANSMCKDKYAPM